MNKNEKKTIQEYVKELIIKKKTASCIEKKIKLTKMIETKMKELGN